MASRFALHFEGFPNFFGHQFLPLQFVVVMQLADVAWRVWQEFGARAVNAYYLLMLDEVIEDTM